MATTIFTVWLAVSLTVSAVTFVRDPNLQGPNAVYAGRECLLRIARSFLNSTQASRTRNMAITHTTRMTQPAADIEVQFLAQMHAAIASSSWAGLQLRIISNKYSTEHLVNVTANAVMLTDYYVLVVDDVEELQRTMHNFIRVGSAYNPAARFVVMFALPSSAFSHTTSMAVAQQVFKLMAHPSLGAMRVAVGVSAGYLKYDIYQTDPYRNTSNCGTLAPQLAGRCFNGTFVEDEPTRVALQRNLVPSKLPGCTFNICMRETPPYIEEQCAEGLEIQLLDTMESEMEFTLRGEKENGSWTELLGMLQKRECDLLAGGFFPDNDVHVDFAVTNTYMQDTYTWYVPKAALEAPWRGLVDIFQHQTWLLFTLILGIAASAWWIFGRATANEHLAHRQPSLVGLNTWAVFLSISANNRPDRTPLRVFFIMLALYGLTVTTVYTSNLITLFTDPHHETQIDTVEAIIAAGLPMGGREEYSDWFADGDTPLDEAVSERYNFSDRFQPRTENLRRIRDGQQTMLMNRFYVLTNILHSKIYELPGNVFVNPLEMITVHSFPLLRSINVMLNRMKDAGLVEKIYTDFVDLMNVRKAVYEEKLHRGEPTRKVLTVNHLQGAFAVLIIGHLFAGFVFVLELVSVTERWRRLRERAYAIVLNALVAVRLAEAPAKPRRGRSRKSQQRR